MPTIVSSAVLDGPADRVGAVRVFGDGVFLPGLAALKERFAR